jgi:hypothetical protein
LLAVLLGAVAGVRAQEKPLLKPSTDAELWLSAGVEWKPFAKKSGQVYERKFYKRFRILGELGYRGNENLTSSKLVYTMAGVRYRITDFLRLGAEYRYNVRDKYTSNSHRVDVQALITAKHGRFDLDYRPSFQHDFVAPVRYRTLLRNRLALAYDIPGFKLDPHLSVETFTALHYTGDRLIGLRYEAGTSVTLDKKKRNSVDLAVRYDREQGLTSAKYRWIFAIGYQFTVKKR